MMSFRPMYSGSNWRRLSWFYSEILFLLIGRGKDWPIEKSKYSSMSSLQTFVKKLFVDTVFEIQYLYELIRLTSVTIRDNFLADLAIFTSFS